MLCVLSAAPFVIESASLSYGGMYKYTMLAQKTQAFLAGKPFTADTIEQAYQFIGEVRGVWLLVDMRLLFVR